MPCAFRSGAVQPAEAAVQTPTWGRGINAAKVLIEAVIKNRHISRGVPDIKGSASAKRGDLAYVPGPHRDAIGTRNRVQQDRGGSGRGIWTNRQDRYRIAGVGEPRAAIRVYRVKREGLSEWRGR